MITMATACQCVTRNHVGFAFTIRIEMYSEGLRDLMEMIMILPFKKPDEKETQLGVTQEKAKSRYFPVYEKV